MVLVRAKYCIYVHNGEAVTDDGPFDQVEVAIDMGPRSIDTERQVVVGGIRHIHISVENGRVVLYCPDGQLDIRPVVQNVATVGVIV